jgi:putative methyltransferase (TIGR04325 family)
MCLRRSGKPWRGAFLETGGSVLDQISKLPAKVRQGAKMLLPPIVVAAARRAFRRSAPTEWEYQGANWPENPPAGWSHESVARLQVDGWQAYVQSIQPPFPPGVSQRPVYADASDIGRQNTAVTFAYVAALAAKEGRLSLLDWGGGVGHYAELARSLFPSLEVEYHCRDLTGLVNAGRELLPNDSFYDSDEDALGRRYDLVMASSSIQYVRDWANLVGRLSRAVGRYLFVTRTPFVRKAPSFVVVQHPQRYGYRSSYPGWFINRDEFLAAADAHELRLVREFLVWEQPFVPGAPEQADYRGFLFAPRQGRDER